MKKVFNLLLLCAIAFLFTGCESKEEKLYCTGDQLIAVNVCHEIKKIENDEEISDAYLCSDKKYGTGEYQFYIKDGKVTLKELTETYGKEYSREAYKKSIESYYKDYNCEFNYDGKNYTVTCKNMDYSKLYSKYNTKEKLKGLMEDKLGLTCT